MWQWCSRNHSKSRQLNTETIKIGADISLSYRLQDDEVYTLRRPSTCFVDTFITAGQTF